MCAAMLFAVLQHKVLQISTIADLHGVVWLLEYHRVGCICSAIHLISLTYAQLLICMVWYDCLNTIE